MADIPTDPRQALQFITIAASNGARDAKAGRPSAAHRIRPYLRPTYQAAYNAAVAALIHNDVAPR